MYVYLHQAEDNLFLFMKLSYGVDRAKLTYKYIVLNFQKENTIIQLSYNIYFATK